MPPKMSYVQQRGTAARQSFHGGSQSIVPQYGPKSASGAHSPLLATVDEHPPKLQQQRSGGSPNPRIEPSAKNAQHATLLRLGSSVAAVADTVIAQPSFRESRQPYPEPGKTVAPARVQVDDEEIPWDKPFGRAYRPSDFTVPHVPPAPCAHL